MFDTKEYVIINNSSTPPGVHSVDTRTAQTDGRLWLVCRSPDVSSAGISRTEPTLQSPRRHSLSVVQDWCVCIRSTHLLLHLIWGNHCLLPAEVVVQICLELVQVQEVEWCCRIFFCFSLKFAFFYLRWPFSVLVLAAQLLLLLFAVQRQGVLLQECQYWYVEQLVPIYWKWHVMCQT